jgi:hypothetical protein
MYTAQCESTIREFGEKMNLIMVSKSDEAGKFVECMYEVSELENEIYCSNVCRDFTAVGAMAGQVIIGDVAGWTRKTKVMARTSLGRTLLHEAFLPRLGRSDVLALDFLSCGSNKFDAAIEYSYLAAGCRDGCVRFLGLKNSSAGFSEASFLIKHPSTVTHVRGISEHEDRFVIVSGLRDQMRLYDLRYLKKDKTKYTVPVVAYKQYRNMSTINHGFELSPECAYNSRYCAVACDQSTTETLRGGPIRIFDIQSGAMVKMFENPKTDMSIHTIVWDNNDLYCSGDEAEVLHWKMPVTE